MKFDLARFEALVESGHVRKVTKGDLVLFNYTDHTTYSKEWCEYTKAARGLILHKDTGEVVARPFPKFFNLGEMPETQLQNLPNEPYRVFEKMDGSLGIIYYYNNKWNVATRGSFDSEQAVKGLELLKKYDLEWFDPGCTYLVEIIYPDNKIVVNYGKDEKLVLLAIINKYDGHEFPIWVETNSTGMKAPEAFSYSIEEAIELKSQLPKDQEGFVIRFQSGLRVKIKGDEYLKIHKMISNMSPLSFWESMVDGVVNKEYLAQLPEEFKAEFEPMVARLEERYKEVMKDIIKDYVELDIDNIAARHVSKEKLKSVGLLVHNQPERFRHPSAVFPYLLEKHQAVDKYIMKFIRPKANVLG